MDCTCACTDMYGCGCTYWVTPVECSAEERYNNNPLTLGTVPILVHVRVWEHILGDSLRVFS